VIQTIERLAVIYETHVNLFVFMTFKTIKVIKNLVHYVMLPGTRFNKLQVGTYRATNWQICLLADFCKFYPGSLKYHQVRF